MKAYDVANKYYRPKNNKSVPLDIKYAICEITAQGNGKFMFKAYGLFDTHMPLLPEKVVGYIVKQMAGVIL